MSTSTNNKTSFSNYSKPESFQNMKNAAKKEILNQPVFGLWKYIYLDGMKLGNQKP